MTEAVTGFVLLMLIAGIASVGIRAYARARNQYLWRRAATWAADAQLQRYFAHVPFDTPPPDGVLPPEVTLRTTTEPGGGQWQGFTYVRVTATVTPRSRDVVQVTVNGYVPEAVP